MDQNMRAAIAVAAVPTETQVFLVVFWMEKTNTETKKVKTLGQKKTIITIDL